MAKQVDVYRTGRQDRSLRTAARKGEAWSEEERELLYRIMIAAESRTAGAQEAARRLRRTFEAVTREFGYIQEERRAARVERLRG